MIAALLFVGAFRSLQYYAVEVLERRLFARVAIGWLSRFRICSYSASSPATPITSWKRYSCSGRSPCCLVDLINVVVGGAVGMTILVFYHPYFLLYNALLLAGFGIVFLLSHGGLKATIEMSATPSTTPFIGCRRFRITCCISKRQTAGRS